MHDSVRAFVLRRLARRGPWIDHVLDVGSLDVNGSMRGAFPYLSYTGIDIRPGPNVDVVADAADLPKFPAPYMIRNHYDVILCLETLEHAKDWTGVLEGVSHVLSVGSDLILTIRSPGAGRHEHPGDYWRWTHDQARAIFGPDAHIEDDPEIPGVLIHALGPLRLDLNAAYAETAPVR